MPITWQNINAPQLDTSYITNAANLLNKGMNQGQQLVEGEINERQDTALQNLRQQAYQDPSLNQEGLNSLIGSAGLDAKRQQQALDFGSKLIRQNTNDDRKLVEQGQADRKFADSLALFKQQTDLRNFGLDSAALDVTNKQATRDEYLKKKADEHIVETVKNDLVGMGDASDDDVFNRMKELTIQYPHLESQIKKTYETEMKSRKELSPALAKRRTEVNDQIQRTTDAEKTKLMNEATQTKKYLEDSPYTAAEQMLKNSTLSNLINKEFSGDSSWWPNDYKGAGDNLQEDMRDLSTDKELIAGIQSGLVATLTKSSKMTPEQIKAVAKDYMKVPDAVLLASLKQMSFDKDDKLVDTTGLNKVVLANALEYYSYQTTSLQAKNRIPAIQKAIVALDIKAKDDKMKSDKDLIAEQRLRNRLNKLSK